MQLLGPTRFWFLGFRPAISILRGALAGQCGGRGDAPGEDVIADIAMWHGWKRCNTPQCSDCLPCCTCLKSQPDSHCQLQAGALSFGKPYFWMERTAVGGAVDARQTTVTVETVWAPCGCKGVPGKAKTQTPCGSALPGWQAAAGCQLDTNRSLHHVDTSDGQTPAF